MSIFHDDEEDGDEAQFSGELHEMNLDAGVVEPSPTARELRQRVQEAEWTVVARGILPRLDDQRVRNTAKSQLRELYGDDFDIDQAPASIDRYEKTLAVERLSKAVVNMGSRPSERHENESDEPHVDQAIKTIAQMKTYGEVAEPHLAHLADSSVMVMPVREAAVDALADLRDQQEPTHDSLREALAAWLRPGGD